MIYRTNRLLLVTAEVYRTDEFDKGEEGWDLALLYPEDIDDTELRADLLEKLNAYWVGLWGVQCLAAAGWQPFRLGDLECGGDEEGDNRVLWQSEYVDQVSAQEPKGDRSGPFAVGDHVEICSIQNGGPAVEVIPDPDSDEGTAWAIVMLYGGGFYVVHGDHGGYCDGSAVEGMAEAPDLITARAIVEMARPGCEVYLTGQNPDVGAFASAVHFGAASA